MDMYKDSVLSLPLGILCDGGDNVFVCGSISHNVQVIAANGKKSGTLLSSSDGLRDPYAINYSKSESAIIVEYLASIDSEQTDTMQI